MLQALVLQQWEGLLQKIKIVAVSTSLLPHTFISLLNTLQKNDFSDKYICNILSEKCKNSFLSDTETISIHTERISTLDF